MDELDFYQLLGVPADASEAEIARAFRRKAFVAHPDHGGDADAFRELYRARETLLHPYRRASYDRCRADPPPRRNQSAQRASGPATGPEPAASDPFEWASGAGPRAGDRSRWATDAWPEPGPPAAYDPDYSWLRSDRFAWWKPATHPESRRRRGRG